MGGMQRTKGVRGELEVVHKLESKGVMARRTAQRMGKSGDAADVVLDGSDLHVEVKRCERLQWKATIGQVVRDSRGKPWIIVHRPNGAEWLVIQTFDNWLADSREAERAREHRDSVIESALAAIRAQAHGDAVSD